MNPLQQIQEDMYNRLWQAPYFDDIGVFLARPRAKGGLAAIQTKVDEHLSGITSRGGKKGVAAIVTMPGATSMDPNVPGPRLLFSFMVRVIERPMQNMGDGGTLKPAEEVALEVLQLFHHFKPNRSFTLVCSSQALVPVQPDSADRVIYDCRFEQLTGLEKPLKVALPTISPNGGAVPQTVTLATSTGGASLLYSLDGSYPALPYSEPLSITSAKLLRCVGTLDGYQQSDVAEAVFN